MPENGEIVAWSAIAGGEDRKASQYRMTLGGSVKSAEEAERTTRDAFAEQWPGVKMTVLAHHPIHEGE
jgi:hypothetical protein